MIEAGASSPNCTLALTPATAVPGLGASAREIAESATPAATWVKAWAKNAPGAERGEKAGPGQRCPDGDPERGADRGGGGADGGGDRRHGFRTRRR